MYRLLATDIDDTLLAPDGALPEANRGALAALHRAGVAIVFCSGRADVSIRAVAQTIIRPDDDEYLIAYNGARIVTADSRRVVVEHNVDSRAIASVMAYARDHGLYVQGYDADRFVVEHESDRTAAYARSTGMDFRVADDLVAELRSGSPKLIVIDDHDRLLSHKPALDRLGTEFGFATMFSKPTYLEIVRAGVHKGAALRELASVLGIGIEQTIAIGDSGNDVEMIRAAGLGLAVARARDDAKAAATVVLNTRAEDGALAEVVARFFPGIEARP
ncbi:MAG: HAD family phosphatase [Spirochaetaceae bacterium]|nr:MAG: HAD family phosphatase [Spirochaetaceae bacterium]